MEGKDGKMTVAGTYYGETHPYNVMGYVEKFPKAGAAAPDGEIAWAAANGALGAKSTLHEALRGICGTDKLAQGVTKCGLLFINMSCPIVRVGAMQEYARMYAKAGLPLLFVYIMEAHPRDGFLPQANWGKWARIYTHKTAEDRAAMTAVLREKLAEQCPELPPPYVVIDAMGDKLEGLYEARPFRHYVIDVPTMTVAYADLGRTPLNMLPKFANARAYFADLATPVREKALAAKARAQSDKDEEAKIKAKAANPKAK